MFHRWNLWHHFNGHWDRLLSGVLILSLSGIRACDTLLFAEIQVLDNKFHWQIQSFFFSYRISVARLRASTFLLNNWNSINIHIRRSLYGRQTNKLTPPQTNNETKFIPFQILPTSIKCVNFFLHIYVHIDSLYLMQKCAKFIIAISVISVIINNFV